MVDKIIIMSHKGWSSYEGGFVSIRSFQMLSVCPWIQISLKNININGLQMIENVMNYFITQLILCNGITLKNDFLYLEMNK